MIGTDAGADAPALKTSGVNERIVTVDGLATRILDEGAGPTVLLLHGGALGCSADDWRGALAPVAAAGFHALAVDLPGFGACDAATDLSVAFRSRYLLALLDQLAIARPTWVGHSQAGRFVVGAALDAPERVASGVVVCTGSVLPPLGAPAPEGKPPDHEPSSAETRAYLESVVFDRALVTDVLVAQYQRFSHGRNFANAVRRATERDAPDVRPAWERLGETTVPLVLIYGADDRGPVTERVVLARDRYPHLGIHLLGHCGHFAQWDQAEAVTGLVIDAARSAAGAL
jgi:4,5:9,10-diseco-3-hydroxy-5,9,17-trioxoandrosta-1(10),2-diene-4-oate hydrolase